MEPYQIFISYRRDGGEFFGKILSDKLIAPGIQRILRRGVPAVGPFQYPAVSGD